MPEDPTRRIFVRAVAAAAGCTYLGLIGYPVYRYLASPIDKAAAIATVKEVKLPDAQKLPPKSALMFLFGETPGFAYPLSEW